MVLTCLADGTKVKPMVVFKHKTMPTEKLLPGIVFHFHPKGWMGGTEDDLLWEEPENNSETSNEQNV